MVSITPRAVGKERRERTKNETEMEIKNEVEMVSITPQAVGKERREGTNEQQIPVYDSEQIG